MVENNGGLTSIKKSDFDKLAQNGKVYATRDDIANGNSANVNSSYYGDNGAELFFDNEGRIIEIQSDGSKVAMGWLNKKDLKTDSPLSRYDEGGSYPETTNLGSQKIKTSTDAPLSRYDEGGSYPETTDIGSQRTINSNATNNSKTISSIATDYYNTPGTTNPHSQKNTGPAMIPIDNNSNGNTSTTTDAPLSRYDEGGSYPETTDIGSQRRSENIITFGPTLNSNDYNDPNLKG